MNSTAQTEFLSKLMQTISQTQAKVDAEGYYSKVVRILDITQSFQEPGLGILYYHKVMKFKIKWNQFPDVIRKNIQSFFIFFINYTLQYIFKDTIHL